MNQLNHVLLFALRLCVLSLGTGCASMVRGDKQTVKFDTDPAGAIVNIDGRDYAAPTDVELARGKSHAVKVSAPGYQPTQFTLEPKWDAAILGNLLLPAGAAGFLLDASAGSAMTFSAVPTIRLEPTTAPATVPVSMRDGTGAPLERD